MNIVTNECLAERSLKEKEVLKTFTTCPYCGNKHFGKVRRNLHKCYRCKGGGKERKCLEKA